MRAGLIITALCIVGVVATVLVSPARREERSPPETVAFIAIAKLDGVSTDAMKVARINSLLEQLSSAYGEPPMRLADMAVVAQTSMRESGVDEPLLEILEGMNRIAIVRLSSETFAGPLALYVVLRKKGLSHADAIETLTDVSVRLHP